MSIVIVLNEMLVPVMISQNLYYSLADCSVRSTVECSSGQAPARTQLGSNGEINLTFDMIQILEKSSW